MSNQQPATAIHASHNPLVEFKDFKFTFRKDELGNKRPAVELKLAVPSIEGLIKILENGGKGLELLQEVCTDFIRKQAVEFVNEDESINQEKFPHEKILWDTLANLPQADRRSTVIAPEQWAAFAKDYIEVMPGITNKTVQAVTNATVVYLKKFAQIKTDKTSLALLKAQLALYAESKNAEQFADILELLVRRCDAYLVADDVQALVSNL